MKKSKRGKHTGDTLIVLDYLKGKIGEVVSSDQIKSLLKKHTITPSVYKLFSNLRKLNHIDKTGIINRSDHRIYETITDYNLKPIGNKLKYKNIENKVIPLPLLQSLNTTPINQPPINNNFKKTALLNHVIDSPALDIAGIMQHVITVDEQNKLLRKALESIALILDQAGILDNH